MALLAAVAAMTSAAVPARAQEPSVTPVPSASPPATTTPVPTVPPNATPEPEATPVPTVPPAGTTPAPAVPPVATPTPSATPTPVTTRTVRRDRDVLLPVLLVGVPVALLVAGVVVLALLRRSGRAAPAGHAWQEAAWRADGRWEDFRDWLRLGR
jgi:hypothetical protein